eukprot:6176175-Pleurochrysis_carterae.AAC.2
MDKRAGKPCRYVRSHSSCGLEGSHTGRQAGKKGGRAGRQEGGRAFRQAGSRSVMQVHLLWRTSSHLVFSSTFPWIDVDLSSRLFRSACNACYCEC